MAKPSTAWPPREARPGPLQQVVVDAMARDLFHVPTLRHALERLGTSVHAGRTELPERLRAVIVQPHDLRTYDALHAADAAEECYESGPPEGLLINVIENKAGEIEDIKITPPTDEATTACVIAKVRALK